MSAEDWLCFSLGISPAILLACLAWFEEAHGHRIRRERHMPLGEWIRRACAAQGDRA